MAAADPTTRDPKWAARLFAAQGRALATVLLGVMALSCFTHGETFWRTPRDFWFDSYQRWVPRKVDRFPVAIIDIDDESLAQFGRWPWPRSRLAQLVEAAQQLGPMAIGLDIVMPEADSQSAQTMPGQQQPNDPARPSARAGLAANDRLLANALRQAPSVVARAALIDAPATATANLQQTPMVVIGELPQGAVQKYAGQLGNLEAIEAAARGRGYVNDTRDGDGVVRTTPLVLEVAGTLAPAFAIEVLRVATGQTQFLLRADSNGMLGVQIGSSFIPTAHNGRVRIYYSPAYAERRISAAALLRGTVAAGTLKQHVAIIGATAVGIGDIVATPVATRMSGVEVHAQLIENILAGNLLMRPAQAKLWELVGLMIASALLIAFLPRLSPEAAVGGFAAICAILGLGSFVLFYRWRWLIDPSFSVAGSGAVFACLYAAAHWRTHRRRLELGAALAIARDERMRVDGELRAAREIQMGMLPDPKQIAGLPPTLDFFALVEPAQQVGGDFYEAVMLDEQRLFFMIGDVSGKGIPAALFMALTKALGKSMARREPALDRLLAMVNEEVARENPASLFVTIIVGVVDGRTGYVEWCNAGHPPPLLLRRDHSPIELAGAEGPPLCVDEHFHYRTHACQLTGRELLLFATDGVSEAENGAQQHYGWQRVRDCFENRFPENAERCCQTLHADVRQFAAGADSADDLAILAIGFRGALNES